MGWDTAGHENFLSVTRSYYRNSSCVLLVYDVSSKDSFRNIKEKWINEIEKYCPKKTTIILIGNKKDLYHKRKITYKEGEQYAKSNNFIFFEISTLENDLNQYEINNIFDLSANNIYNKINNNYYDNLKNN